MTKKREKLSEAFDRVMLRSSNLKELAGLSYRQLNDWDSKGILPTERKDKAKWRTFGARSVLTLQICKEFRDKFGVPLEKLIFIKERILDDETNYFQHALELMAYFGVTVYLVTDLKNTFMVETDNELGILFQMGAFKGSDSANYLVIKLNPLINKMMIQVGVEPCETNDSYYNTVAKNREDTAVKNREEAEVLRLIRDKKYRQVLIRLKDGKIIRADAEEELTSAEMNRRDKDLLAIVKGSKYQTVTIKSHDGKIVRLSRSTPIKFDKGTEKS
ncbi:MerR family transcriptional regulator [Candidatus Peregrinibacteria bacterium]|nr:MerR family transcriptional regulator [Candidatus Peregrinibacteria bacterium]